MMRRLQLLLRLVLSALFLLAIGCTDQGDDPVDPSGPGPVSWDDDIAPLLASNCLSTCHEQGGIAPRVPFEDYAQTLAFTTSSGTPLVVAGEPDSSELVGRIEGDGFNVMPPSGSLPTDQVELVREWVSEGAPQSP